MINQRPCPVCDSTPSMPLWKDKVHECLSCGMVYDPKVEPANYEKMEAYALAEPDPMRAEKTFSLIEPYLSGRILEIGCGRGDLLAAMKRHGVKAKGIDIGKANLEECRKNGLDVAVGSIYDNGSGEHDFIILMHVIEHLSNVRTGLAKLRQRLSGDGHVYIECPDATRHVDHISAPLQEFNTEHINHFSPMLLLRVLLTSGLYPVSFGTRSLVLPDGQLYPAMWVIAKRCERL